MPELMDTMYCHQQICIPPTYPYLLRQYAKAAIRSQPNDLLRWSCAYFRALAQGIKPPVKVRLEYPITSTHYGLTPGWLKTLIQQFAGYVNVTWPQLYDRWRGICLQVPGLQEIIMMAGFLNPAEVPWLRFVACAAGHLTANLTNTMILICELLTDEPEGGSAMIPYSTFADLYKFLAEIDGCEERMVHNFYFTESNLDLTKHEESMMADDGKDQLDRSLVTTMEEDEESEEHLSRRSDLEKYLKGITDGGEEDLSRIDDSVIEIKGKGDEKLDTHSSCYIILDPEDGKICRDGHEKSVSSSESSESSEKEVAKVVSKSLEESAESEEIFQFSQESESKPSEESSTLTMATDDGLDVVPADFKLPIVPGIGAVVPPEMIGAVLRYMKEQANRQQGMVMPRNIKHFLCPSLEVCVSTTNI